jgi:hypothetical protein
MVAKFLISSVLLFSLVCSEKNCEICYFVEFFFVILTKRRMKQLVFVRIFDILMLAATSSAPQHSVY